MSRLLAQKYRLAGMALLLVFASYWCGITLFTHSHVVNGVIVVHSHPFKAGHTHTDTQLETISTSLCCRLPAKRTPVWPCPAGLFLWDWFSLSARWEYLIVRARTSWHAVLPLFDFSGHILPVYESWNIYYFKDCSSGTAPALHTFSWVYARLPGELCFAFGATLQAGFVTAVVNLSHRYAKDSAFLCRDFCFAVINRSDRDELRTTIV